MEKIAFYPGSFDPVTIGHLDIIERGAKLFDKVVVVVMSNHAKVNTHSFTVEERVELLKKCTCHMDNVEIDSSMGLLADYARKRQASAIIKGLRAVSDFENEFQQALINNKLSEECETLFMAANAEHMFLSSSVIKQVCQLGGDVTPILPKQISEDVINKLRNQ